VVSATSAPLVDRLWRPRGRVERVLRVAALVIVGSLALAVSARVQIPFVPVPFTMQTAVVLVIGLSFGRGLGAATVAAYLLEGAAGLPVFAAGGGLAYLASSPTAGYLWGMLAATLVMGWLSRAGWSGTRAGTLAAMLVGTGVIFTVGVAWLARQVGVDTAVAVGLRPFVASEALKIALVAVALPEAQRLVHRLDR
jgi:biotin transport system substrate-specific component